MHFWAGKNAPAAGSTGHTKLRILKNASFARQKAPAAGSTGHTKLRIFKNVSVGWEKASAAGSRGHKMLIIARSAFSRQVRVKMLLMVVTFMGMIRSNGIQSYTPS